MTKRAKVLGGIGAAMATGITAMLMLTASTINVPVGGDVQAAINSAGCGDTIILQAGAIYVQPITLPAKTCLLFNSDITIQSSRANELPEDKRVGPAQAHLLAWLQSNVNAEPVIKTAPGAHHYKFIGIRASTANEGVFVYDLIRWGDGRGTQKTLAQVPHHLVWDRGYIHGWPTQDVLRGVAANAAHWEVTNSYISDIHWVGLEAQAINSWNGPGPSKIINNYLEAAGENVMFGGADSAAPELMPADLEVRRNYMFKPLSWKVGHATYAGKHWTVKNIFELKAVKRAVVEGNLFENNWTDAQDGTAILFTVRNQECTANWSTVQGVTFRDNIVKGVEGAALNFLGIDNEATPEYIAANPDKCRGFDPAKLGSERGTDALVTNNLFYDIKGGFMQLNGFNNLTVSNNTHFQNGNTITFYGKDVSQGFAYRDNVTTEKPYGVRDESGTQGIAALEKSAPSSTFTGNVMAHPPLGSESWYFPMPSGNEYPPGLTIGTDFRTPYVGKGANIDQLLAAQAGVVSGPIPVPSVSPSASPSIQPSPSATGTVAPLPSPTPTQAPLPSPTPTSTPTPQPSPSPQPSPVRCLTTSWPSSTSGRNAKMAERRTQGCYPVRQPNLNTMEYARP